MQNIFSNFLGNSPKWYKYTILGFLALNPLALAIFGMEQGGYIMVWQYLEPETQMLYDAGGNGH